MYSRRQFFKTGLGSLVGLATAALRITKSEPCVTVPCLAYPEFVISRQMEEYLKLQLLSYHKHAPIELLPGDQLSMRLTLVQT